MANLLEKNILNKVDQLVQVIIELSSVKADKSFLKRHAIDKTLELIPLLLHFLDGNISHVEPMLRQLIMEKLPDSRIISSFGNFQEQLNMVLKEVMINFLNNPDYYLEQRKKIDIGYENFADAQSFNSDNELLHNELNSLNRSVFKVFPNRKIIFNYIIRGENIDVYLPELNIALIRANKKKYIKINYFCKKMGIRLIQIPSEIEEDHRRLMRYIKRATR